jgi:hypothetical protein
MASFGPAAIPVHDDGDVVREALGIEFVKKLRFLAVGRLPEVGCFHGEITRGVSATESSTGGVWAQDLEVAAELQGEAWAPFYRRLEVVWKSCFSGLGGSFNRGTVD